MSDAVIKTKFVEFLEAHPEGATADVLAQEVMGLQGAQGAIAQKVVSTALEGDARFARLASGMWTFKARGKKVGLDATLFVCLGCVSRQDGGDGIWLAGRRMQLQGDVAPFAKTWVGLDGDGFDTLQAFANFSEGAVPVAFRLPRFRSAINRLGRMILGRPFLPHGICLFRLGRRFFPDTDLPNLEALATVLGFSYVTDRDADAEASLQTQVLQGLLERCVDAGMDSVESLVADLYPDATPVQFEAYAFDESYLRELPESPGVYIMRDQAGKVIYVGKAVNLRNRVGSYFAKRSERPEKTQRILDRIWSMEVETVGSELAALLLEAQLIGVCQPEFNTQKQVHSRPVDLGVLKNMILVLASDDADAVDLVCFVEKQPLSVFQVQQDLSNWGRVSEALRALYFEASAKPTALNDVEKGAVEIAKSWFAQHKDQVNYIDVDGLGTASDVLRVVGEYVQQCEAEDWEKVVWRV